MRPRQVSALQGLLLYSSLPSACLSVWLLPVINCFLDHTWRTPWKKSHSHAVQRCLRTQRWPRHRLTCHFLNRQEEIRIRCVCISTWEENQRTNIEFYRRANSFVYFAFSLSNRHKDVIVNLSGRSLTASIWTLDTVHFIKDVSGATLLRSMWTCQLIKARHSDSFVALSVSLSLCAACLLRRSYSPAKGPTARHFKAWTRASLACLHKKRSSSSPKSLSTVRSVAVISSLRWCLQAEPINKELHFSHWDQLRDPGDLEIGTQTTFTFLGNGKELVWARTSEAGPHSQGEDERFHWQVHICILTQIDEDWNLKAERERWKRRRKAVLG